MIVLFTTDYSNSSIKGTFSQDNALFFKKFQLMCYFENAGFQYVIQYTSIDEQHFVLYSDRQKKGQDQITLQCWKHVALHFRIHNLDHFIAVNTFMIMASPNSVCKILQMLISAVGIVVGGLGFIFFKFHYNNDITAYWAMMSGLMAALVFFRAYLKSNIAVYYVICISAVVFIASSIWTVIYISNAYTN